MKQAQAVFMIGGAGLQCMHGPSGLVGWCEDHLCRLSLHFHSFLMCLHTHVCVGARGSQRLTSDMFPSHFPLDFSRQSCNKPGAHQFSSPGWLESQRILLSTFTSPRLQVFAATSSFLYRCWGSELKSSCRHSKYFTN